jgi:lipopolysaccharide biosynthesis regulator YciM
MGLFNSLGRKVEKLKQQAESASKEEASYQCENCEALLYTDHEACPECDASGTVRALDTE